MVPLLAAPECICGGWACLGDQPLDDRLGTHMADERSTGADRPVRLRVATKTRLVVETGQGVIESRDAGRTWSTRTPVSDRRAAQAMRLPAYIRTRSGAEGDTGVPVSSNDRRLQVPKRFYTGAVAFRTEQRGLLA